MTHESHCSNNHHCYYCNSDRAQRQQTQNKPQEIREFLLSSVRARNSTEIYVCRAANCWLAWKQKSLWINAMCLACVDICYLMDCHVCAASCHCALVLILSVSFSQWERETWLRLEKYRPAFLASGKTQTWALSVSNYPLPLDFRDCRWDSQAQIKTLTVMFCIWGQDQAPCRLNISTGQGRSNVSICCNNKRIAIQ